MKTISEIIRDVDIDEQLCERVMDELFNFIHTILRILVSLFSIIKNIFRLF